MSKPTAAGTRYLAVLDGDAGAFGVTFPDLPGVTAMGATPDKALIAAVDALRDWAEVTLAAGGEMSAPRGLAELMRDPDAREEIEAGFDVATVPLILESGRTTKANLSLDAGLLAAMDATAARVGLTRSALVEALARRHLHEFS